MKITLIAAMTKNHVIGKENTMPWHLPADLRHFKELTLHKSVVMGRKTFESIGRPLPLRRNIVISKQREWVIPGVEVYSSIDVMLDRLCHEPEIMIIGGQTLFQQMLGMATTMYLTIINTLLEGDTFFPVWNAKEWRMVSEETHAADKDNAFGYQFVQYCRDDKTVS